MDWLVAIAVAVFCTAVYAALSVVTARTYQARMRAARGMLSATRRIVAANGHRDGAADIPGKRAA